MLMTTQHDNLNISFAMFRRHSRDCKYGAQGRRHFGCKCPIWGDGYLDGERILRKSLGTREAADANARMARLIEVCSRTLRQHSDLGNGDVLDFAIKVEPQILPSPHSEQAATSKKDGDPAIIENAVKAFLDNCETNGIRSPTIRKYRNSLKRLAEFAKSNNLWFVHDLKVTHLDRFRAARAIAPITSQKELETLRQFWSYCVTRDLCKENIAQKIKGPTIVSPMTWNLTRSRRSTGSSRQRRSLGAASTSGRVPRLLLWSCAIPRFASGT
jgi:hypothetical protein